MCAVTNSTEADKKTSSRKFKAVKWILIVLAVFFLLLFFTVPMYLSSASGKGLIVNKVNNSIDGKIGMSTFSLGWFKGIRLTDFTFADDAGKTTVNVKEISAKPHYTSLLSGSMSFDEVVIDTPEVSIDLDITDTTVPRRSDKRASSTAAEKKKNVGLPIGQIDLTVKNGNVTINSFDKDSRRQTLHFKNIASKVDIKPAGEQSKFDVALDVEGPAGSSQVTANGNLKTSPKKKWTMAGTSGEVNVKVKDLDLATLKPVFALLDKQIDVSGVLNIDAQAKVDEGKINNLTVDSVLTGFRQTIDGREIILDEPLILQAKTSSRGDKVTVEKIELKSSFCNITAKGTPEELDYTATADLAGTMDFIGSFIDLGDYRFAGQGYEEGKILFSDGKIRFADHSSIDNFVISKKGKPDTPATSAKFTFDMTVDMDKQNLKIDFLTMNTVPAMANIAISDTLLSWAEDEKKKIDLNVKADIVLAKAMPFAKFFEAIPDKMQLAGLLKTGLTVQSAKKGGFRIFTDQTSIADLMIATVGVEETFEDELLKIKLDMTADPDKKSYAFKEVSIDGSKIDIAGTFDQTTAKSGMTKLKGNVTANYDLADVSTIASAYLPEGLQMQGTRSDVIRFESQYPQTAPQDRMANMNASANFGFNSAKYMGMNIGSAEIDINVKQGLLEIAPFSTNVNNGKLNFAASLDLNAKPAVFKIPAPIQIIENIDVNDEMGKLLLKYLNPVFADQADLSGIANLHCEKLSLPLGGDAAISFAEIVATIAISDMNMKSKGLMGQIMSQANTGSSLVAEMLPSDFILQNGILSYDDMQINIDRRYPINFKGSVDLNGRYKKLNMLVALPYVIDFDGFEPKFKTIKIGQRADNRVTLPIEGTVDKHNINLGKFFEDIIKGNVEQFLQKGIEGFLKKSGSRQSGGTQGSPEEELFKGILDALK